MRDESSCSEMCGLKDIVCLYKETCQELMLVGCCDQTSLKTFAAFRLLAKRSCTSVGIASP